MHHLHFDPVRKPGSKASDPNGNTQPQPTYRIVNNQKRSGALGSSLSQPSYLTAKAEVEASANGSTHATYLAESAKPSPLPQILEITFSTTSTAPSVITAPGSSPDTAPIFHLHTQSIRTPHLSLFTPPPGDEFASATIADRGGDIACVVRGVGFSVKQKGKFSSSFLFTHPTLGEMTWKGDRKELTCVDGQGREMVRFDMGKPSKKNDWVVVARFEFLGMDGGEGGEGTGMGVGEEVKEALLLSGLAVQECKKRKGQGIWGTIGSGGLNSTMI